MLEDFGFEIITGDHESHKLCEVLGRVRARLRSELLDVSGSSNDLSSDYNLSLFNLE